MMNRKLITEAPVVGPAESPRTIVRTASALLVKYNMVGVFILMVIVSSIMSDVFLTPQNIFNLLVQVSGASIASLGMLLVILTGGIDLSVGSVFALSSVVLGLSTLRFPLALALLIAILVSCASGSLVGYLVAGRGMAPFMATLAFMTIDRGMAFILSKGSPISLPESASALNTVFGTESLLGVPYPVLLMFVVFVYVLFTLRFSVFGRLIVGIGSNETAVLLSGIQVRRYKFLVYVLSAGLSALGGVISTARTGVGSPVVGEGVELDAIAAVVIGGGSLMGGKGTALNTLLGALILGMIGNIMNLMNVAGYPQEVVKGVIIIVALLLQGIRRPES